MKHFVITSLISVTLLGCSAVKPEDAKNSTFQLPDSPLTISTNKSAPVFNDLYYVEPKSPSRQVVRNFLFQGLNETTVVIGEPTFLTQACKDSGAAYAWYLVRGDQAAELKVGRPFQIIFDDRILSVVKNPGECEVLRLQFAVVNQTN